MSCYPASTQKRFWILTREDIESRRSEARSRAIESARDARAGGEPLPGDGPDPLTDEEETLLRRYYEAKILKVCAAFSLPSKVQATAVTLFKRFLMGTSLLQHNLKVMMLTSIYVACKVEENYVSAEEFGKGMHEDASRVLNAELTLLSGLQFQLVTYSPYRAVHGFRCDLEEMMEANELDAPAVSREKLDECVGCARRTVDKLMLTDAPLIYAPGKLGLTAFRAAGRELKIEAVQRYVESVQAREEAPESGALLGSLNALDTMARVGGEEPKEEVVRHIDKKLKTWRTSNPVAKAAGDGDGKEGREGKRHKSASKATRDAEEESAFD
jgi:cyclin H